MSTTTDPPDECALLDLKHEIDALRGALAIMEIQNAEVEQQRDETRARVADLERERDAARAERDEAERERNEARVRLDVAGYEADTLAGAVDLVIEHEAEHHAREDSIRALLVEAERERNEARASYVAADFAHVIAVRDLDDTRVRLVELRGDVADAVRDLRAEGLTTVAVDDGVALAVAVRDVVAHHQSHHRDRDALRTRCADLERDRDEWRKQAGVEATVSAQAIERAADLERERDAARRGWAEAQAGVEHLTRSLDDARRVLGAAGPSGHAFRPGDPQYGWGRQCAVPVSVSPTSAPLGEGVHAHCGYPPEAHDLDALRTRCAALEAEVAKERDRHRHDVEAVCNNLGMPVRDGASIHDVAADAIDGAGDAADEARRLRTWRDDVAAVLDEYGVATDVADLYDRVERACAEARRSAALEGAVRGMWDAAERFHAEYLDGRGVVAHGALIRLAREQRAALDATPPTVVPHMHHGPRVAASPAPPPSPVGGAHPYDADASLARKVLIAAFVPLDDDETRERLHAGPLADVAKHAASHHADHHEREGAPLRSLRAKRVDLVRLACALGMLSTRLHNEAIDEDPADAAAIRADADFADDLRRALNNRERIEFVEPCAAPPTTEGGRYEG
jgi:hypothetical protein